MRIALLVVVVLLGTQQQLLAQSGPTARESASVLSTTGPAEVERAASEPTRRLVWTASGAAAGTLLGGWMGYEINRARSPDSENAGIFGMLGGALLGSTVGSALGSHWGAEGEGSLTRRFLVSGAIAVVGAGFAAVTEDEVQIGFSIAIPVAQVLALGR